MKDRNIVIVGSGIAGLSAAIAARQVGNVNSITILSREKCPPYCKPSLARVILGTVMRREEIEMYPEDLLRRRRITTIPGLEVLSVDPERKVLRALDTGTGKSKSVGYDFLILATGGHEFVPPINGRELENVFTLRIFADALKMSETAESGRGAVVVGAGPIALSIAESSVKRGLRTRMIVRSRILRTLVESEFSEMMKDLVEKKGVECLVNAEIEEVGGSKRVEYVRIQGRTLGTSMVVFATGTRPSVELAENAGVKVGESGIEVDEYMRTSRSDIFAAGDCAETMDFVTKRRIYLPIGSIGAQEGVIAGANAAGARVKGDGFIRVQTDNFFGTEVTSIGHCSETAKQLGLEVKALDIQLSGSIIRPGLRKSCTRAKIIIDNRGRIVGAQVLGHRFAAEERYVLFQAIKERMKIDEFEDQITLKPIAQAS